MEMPFGKFKGYRIEELPENYILWLWATVELFEPLKSEVRRCLPGSSREMIVLEPDRVKKVYRELSLKWHPDRGGSTTAMQAINEFNELLMEG